MKLELSKVQYSKALSQETHAFVAAIVVDGKVRGEVRNDGCGGSHIITPRDLEVEIEAHAKTLPPVDCFGKMLEVDADFLMGIMIEDWIAARDLARKMKKSIIFTAENGKIYTSRVRPTRNVAKILNDMPFPEALALFKSAAE